MTRALGTVLALAALTVMTRADILIDERNLHEQLFRNYDKTIRPVANKTDKVTIDFGLAVIDIIKIDEFSNTLQASYWLRYLWKDVNLSWNVTEHNGINTIRVETSKIWRPDITLYNRVGKPEVDTEILSVIYHTGEVLHIPPAIMTSSCQFDLTNFPFDKQTCSLKFISWAYDMNEIDVDLFEGMESADLSDLQPHPEWEIHSSTGKRNEVYYPCCSEGYPDLTFNLTLQRKNSFFSHLFTPPAIVISLVTPFMFALPVNEPHRYILGSGLCISSSVLTTAFDYAIPSNDNAPLLGRWFVAVFVINLVALVSCAVVSSIADRETHGQIMPSIIKKVLLAPLARCLCVQVSEARILMKPLNDVDGSDVIKGDSDWLLLARALNRLFFVVYIAVFLVLLICFCSR